jgi:hypothetical protein
MADSADSNQVDPALLRFISKEGEFVSIRDLLPLVGRDALMKANQSLLEGFGCQTPELQEEGLNFLLEINLSKTFNSWEDKLEGRSGVSSKKLNPSELKPGGILTLVGLLKAHPASVGSGDLSVSYNNPERGSRR